MVDLIADLFVSLDGFASGIDVGPFFGYSGAELGTWVREALDQPQVVVMGRVTYEAMAKISSSATDDVSTRMNDLPKVVFSNTLQEPLAWKNTRLLRGDLAEGIRGLKQQSDVPLRSIGSLTLVRSMVRLGLVDRLRVMIFPLTLGQHGRDPAYVGYPRAGLELVETKILDSRVVLLDYRPAGVAGG